MLDIMVKSGRGLNKECGCRCFYKLIKWPYLCREYNYRIIRESNLFFKNCFVTLKSFKTWRLGVFLVQPL